MNQYVTKQGETVDLACFRYYGHTRGVLEPVLKANPGLAGLGLIPPMGTNIAMPDPQPVKAAPLVSLWD